MYNVSSSNGDGFSSSTGNWNMLSKNDGDNGARKSIVLQSDSDDSEKLDEIVSKSGKSCSLLINYLVVLVTAGMPFLSAC